MDGVSLERFARNLDPELRELSSLLRSGTYQPLPLRRLERDANGKRRVFGLPAVRDRVAQHAFLHVFAGMLDAQLVDTCFAYRKGAGWLAALERVEQARDQGLRWVVRADVADFFESIDHERLLEVLTEVIPGQGVVDLVRRWITAPMMTGNGLVERDRGLALGTPVSPLLANQYLGGVDREVGRHGLVVRYADDFAVLCPSLEQADAAWGQMERSLHERGLRLNHAKSYVSTFDKGFAFLGWVFWRDGGHEEHVREQSGAPGWSHPLSRRPGQGRGQERWVS